MTERTAPPTEALLPATFQERGAAPPFTTPMLAGARVRKAQRPGLELVVLNPSGGRGFYVLRSSGILAFCRPTVHDTILFSRLAGLTAIDPVAVREAALSIAQEGHAGREAIAAAEATIAADQAQHVKTYARMSMRFIEQVDPTSTVQASAATATRVTDIDHRIQPVLDRLAPSLGCPAGRLATALAAISKAFAPVGASPDDSDARLVRLITRLEQTSDSLSEWVKKDSNNDIGGLGEAVAVAMQAACKGAKAVLRNTRLLTTNPAALVKRWNTDPTAIQAQVMRCDWLLDGWEGVAMLWLLAATDGQRRAATLEMPLLVPEPPLEIASWTDTVVPSGAMDLICRVTSLDNAWRTGGAAYPLVERSEKMRAMST